MREHDFIAWKQVSEYQWDKRNIMLIYDDANLLQDH